MIPWMPLIMVMSPYSSFWTSLASTMWFYVNNFYSEESVLGPVLQPLASIIQSDSLQPVLFSLALSFFLHWAAQNTSLASSYNMHRIQVVSLCFYFLPCGYLSTFIHQYNYKPSWVLIMMPFSSEFHIVLFPLMQYLDPVLNTLPMHLWHTQTIP